MNSIMRFVTGSVWAFLGRIGALALALISSMLLARILTPADFGAYFLVLTVARVAMLISQFGMNQVVVRLIAENTASGFSSKARDVVLKAFAITLAGCIFVGAFYLSSSAFVSIKIFDFPVVATVSGLVVVWIVAGSLRLLAAECFRGFHDLKLASIFELFTFELLFACLVFVAWSNWGKIDFHDAVSLSVVAAFVSALPALFLLHKKIKLLPINDNVTYRALLQIGWPLLVSNVVFVIMNQAGLWVVGVIATPEDVALYASAFRLVLLMQLPLLILNSVVPQLIAELHICDKRAEIEESLQLIALVEFIPTLLVYLVFWTWGQALLSLVFGEFYVSSYLIMIILGAGIMVNAIVGFCGPTLMMTGHHRSLMLISLVCGVFALVFSFPAGKYWGGEGVAAVMACANVLQHLWMLLVVKRKVGVWTMVGNFTGLRRVLSIVR